MAHGPDVSELDSLTAAFITAVHDGEADRLRALLTDHPEAVELIGAPLYPFGGSAVHCAASHERFGVLEVLVEFGADLDRPSEWQNGPYTALHSAVGGAGCFQPAVVQWLIEHGATIDFHSAASLSRFDLVTAELERDPAAIHRRGPDGQLPLHFAGSVEMAQLLLDHGADPAARCVDHTSTAAQWQARWRPEVARFLLDRGAPLDVFTAVILGDESLLAQVLAAEPDALTQRLGEPPFVVGERGDIQQYHVGHRATPLHVAAVANHPQLVAPFVDAGLPADVRGAYDEATPLHLAAWEGHVEVAAALLDAGAPIDVNSGEQHQNSPLGWAIVAGRAAMVELLLDRGAPLRDYYLHEARVGQAGQFAEFSPGKLAEFAAIERTLRARGATDPA